MKFRWTKKQVGMLYEYLVTPRTNKPMIQIKGNRLLVTKPQVPLRRELCTDPLVMFHEVGPMRILLPEDNKRKVSEWEVLSIGGPGRSGKPPEELKVGQHVLVSHDMGFQLYVHEGKRCRIYSCCDVLAILSDVNNFDGYTLIGVDHAESVA